MKHLKTSPMKSLEVIAVALIFSIQTATAHTTINYQNHVYQREVQERSSQPPPPKFQAFEVDFGRPYYHNVPWQTVVDSAMITAESYTEPVQLQDGVPMTGQQGHPGLTMVYELDAGPDKEVECSIFEEALDESCSMTMSKTTTAAEPTVAICFRPSKEMSNMTILCSTQEKDEEDCWENLGCFSGDMMVQTIDNSPFKMTDLQVGDRVLVQTNLPDKPSSLADLYQPIYAFGHYAPTTKFEYLKLHTNATTTPLELTGSHLMYKSDVSYPVRADQLQVGDLVWWQPSSQGAIQELAAITRIQRITRTGAYLPLTESGTIVVNGLLASTYVSVLLQTAPTLIPSVLSTSMIIYYEYLLFHGWLAPYRMVCTRLKCPQEFNQDGILPWLAWGQSLLQWIERQPTVLQNMFFPFSIAWCFTWLSLEIISNTLLQPRWLVIVILLVGAFRMSQYQAPQKAKQQ